MLFLGEWKTLDFGNLLRVCVFMYSFNVKGIRDLLKRKAIFLCLKRFKADFYLLQETHAITSDFVFWKNQWGSDIWLAYGSNQQGLQF